MSMSSKQTNQNAHGAASSGHSDMVHHHVLPLKTYYAVFTLLLVLTIVTVLVSYAAFPQPWALIIAMVVAMIKATFVASYFMHLKWDVPYNKLIFFGSLFFLGLFFFFTFADLTWRGRINPEERGVFQPPNAVHQIGTGAEKAGENAPAHGK